ncbi:MAG: hypothetical protein ABI627_12485 [Polyangiaceae bacterium]
MNRLLIAALLFGASGALFAGVAVAEGAADCAAVTASTRLEAYGYTHVVTLSNRCSAPVSCEVWTNVDPSPHVTLRAKAGESVETVTRRGSPSRDVQAGKQCAFAK